MSSSSLWTTAYRAVIEPHNARQPASGPRGRQAPAAKEQRYRPGPREQKITKRGAAPSRDQGHHRHDTAPYAAASKQANTVSQPASSKLSTRMIALALMKHLMPKPASAEKNSRSLIYRLRRRHISTTRTMQASQNVLGFRARNAHLHISRCAPVVCHQRLADIARRPSSRQKTKIDGSCAALAGICGTRDKKKILLLISRNAARISACSFSAAKLDEATACLLITKIKRNKR